MKFATQIPNDDKILFHTPLKVNCRFVIYKLPALNNVDIRHLYVIKDTIFFISYLKKSIITQSEMRLAETEKRTQDFLQP